MLARILSLQTHQLVAIAVLSALLTGGVVGMSLTDVFRAPSRSTANHARMTMLRGEALRLDEVLTLSCEVATLTGDPVWRERYDRSAADLTSTMQSIENLSMQIFGKPFGRKATEASRRMTSAERQSFELADSGDSAGGIALLQSERYSNDKSSFVVVLDSLLADIDAVVADQKNDQRKLGIALGLIILVIVCVLNWVLFRARESAIRISESRTAELASEQQRLSALIEHAPVAVAMLDNELNFIATSRRWMQDYGLLPETTIGKNLQDVDLCVPSRLRRVFQRCLAGVNNAHGDQAWIPTGSDEERHLMWEARPWTDADGMPGGTIVFTHDITEERKVQQDLLRQQATAAHMSRLAGVGWWDLTVETNSVVWSDQTYTIHGVDDDFVPTLDNALSFYSDSSRKIVTECVTSAIENQTAFRFKERLTTADGRSIWMRCLGEPVVQDGQVTRIVGACQDVTAEHTAAERPTESKRVTEETAAALAIQHQLINGVVDSMPDGVYWKDSELRYVGCNAVYASLLGFDSPAELIGHTDTDLGVPSWSEVDAYVTDQQVFDEGIKLTNIEVLVSPNDADSHVVLVSKSRLSNGSGVATGVMGIWRDVTEFRELERDLAQARKLESIGQLSAGIAHEINTPMQCVSINLEFLQEHCSDLFAMVDRCLKRVSGSQVVGDATDEQQLEPSAEYELIRSQFPDALGEANDATARIVEIISAMKAMSHSGDHAKVRSDVKPLIHNAATVSRHRWKAIADLNFDLAADLPEIEIMPAEISQVWLNMIVNSCDAIVDRVDGDRHAAGNSPDAIVPGRITLHAEVQGDGIAFACVDNGCGIPEHVQQRMFDPFFTTKQVGSGTGQGLAITYDIIVKRHGGRIQVESVIGGGTRMEFWIPMTACAAAERNVQAAQAERGSAPAVLSLAPPQPPALTAI